MCHLHLLQIHFILRHTNPLNGTISEKHHKDKAAPLVDRLVHVYTLRIRPDNS